MSTDMQSTQEMGSVLILKNAENEGPGTIGDHLRAYGIPFRIIELSKGEKIPATDMYTCLVIMGGPMSVHDTAKYPYLQAEEELVRTFSSDNRKILGICLGAQIMAKAFGAEVYRGDEEEIGWYDIELSEAALRDPCAKTFSLHPGTQKTLRKFKVFHWHGETFTIPTHSEKLAGSERYANQAFRYGNYGYAFQFHIEVTKEMIYDWFRNSADRLGALKTETDKYYPEYHERAVKFYEVFF